MRSHARPTVQRRVLRSIQRGSAVESLSGALVVALAIIGLAGGRPPLLGLGLILAGLGSFLGGRIDELAFPVVARLEGSDRASLLEVSGGLLTDIVGGVTGLVLGTLQLAGLVSLSSLAVAVTVMGVMLIFGSGETGHLTDLFTGDRKSRAREPRWATESVQLAGTAELLLGLGAAACGALACVGIATLACVCGSMLALGAANLLTGAALFASVAAIRRRSRIS